MILLGLVVVILPNNAVTFLPDVIGTIQAPVPEQSPLHCLNCQPVSACGVRVTLVSSLYCPEQSPGQSIPAGELVTLPDPSTETVRACWMVELISNTARTYLNDVTETVQAPVPEQAPPHCLNCQPESACGVRVTLVPWLYCWEQSPGQLIPAGELVTLPEPLIKT